MFAKPASALLVYLPVSLSRAMHIWPSYGCCTPLTFPPPFFSSWPSVFRAGAVWKSWVRSLLRAGCPPDQRREGLPLRVYLPEGPVSTLCRQTHRSPTGRHRASPPAVPAAVTARCLRNLEVLDQLGSISPLEAIRPRGLEAITGYAQTSLQSSWSLGPKFFWAGTLPESPRCP